MKRTREQFNEEAKVIRQNFDITWQEKDARIAKLYEEWYLELEPGDHAHVRLWSDSEPVTVIKKTPKTLTVRYDKAERDPDWKPEWIPGGFSAVCLNQSEQKWIIEENPDGRTEVFWWSSTKGVYQHHGCPLYPGWYKYYDYNF